MRLFAAVTLGLAAIALPAEAADRVPSAEETRREFERVCRQLGEGRDPYFGRSQVAYLERRLAPEPHLDSIFIEGQLATELLRLGENERALEHVGAARRRLQSFEPSAEERTRAWVIEHALIWTHAMAHLRQAEVVNCIAIETPATCLLPIERHDVHRVPEHARSAGDLFQRFLLQNPETVQGRWLLNLTRMISGDFPEAVPESLRIALHHLAAEAEFERWPNIAREVGLDVFDLAGGALMEDFDGDGLLDLVSSSWDVCEPMKAFRNTGRGGFEEVTRQWGLDGQFGGSNLVQADYDNDGMPDILVLRGGWLGEAGRVRNSLLRNDLKRQARRFLDVTASAGLAEPAYPTQSAAWADFDGDGWLDLYVGNEASGSDADPLRLAGLPGLPYPSQLFRNRGDGTFEDVARRAGVEDFRYTKAVAWGDYDDDGDPDLYVSNLGANRLYRNNGNGTFTDVAPELGVTEPADGSFPTWFFDYDNDGDLDLFVADYTGPVEKVSSSYMGLPTTGGHPVLYRNDGGRFVDVSAEVGLLRPLLPMGANYGDLDNDGWLDFYLGTGVPSFEALMPNVMYRNREGRGFEDVTFAGGFGHLQKGHGIAFGDLDNDGDQDLFAQMGGAFPADGFFNALYLNPGSENRWIVLRLEGRRANRLAVGGRIAVRVRTETGSRTIHALVGSGGSFGGSSLQQEIGLGPSQAIESISITWPGSGLHQTFGPVELDRHYRAIEGEPELEPLSAPRFRLGEGATPAARRPGHKHRAP